MEIQLNQIWKRYTTGWILRDISMHLNPNDRLAISGHNGSGKSTLINIISGYLSYTKGDIRYALGGKEISRDNIHEYLAMSAAYSRLDEEFTVSEIYRHYSVFKSFMTGSEDEFLEISDFKKEKNRLIQSFSSGMKQRLSLALALTMDVPLLIMDEPTSFLDDTRKDWYRNLVSRFCQNKTVIIASNDAHDFVECNKSYSLS